MRYLAALMEVIKILIPLIAFLGITRLVIEIIYRIVQHVYITYRRRKTMRDNGIRPIRIRRVRTRQGGVK